MRDVGVRLRAVLGAPLPACLALLSLLVGCTPLRFATQAAVGQDKITGRGIDIADIVEGKHLDRRTRDLLAHVPKVKAFGERHGLAHTRSYERYVWLETKALVWVVSACDPVAFRPRTWRFPIVGSFTYMGWFSPNDARAYAAEVATEGLDVDVRPSAAYSTLGYFRDPILSTMISSGDEALGDLADTVLHETLHATYYVPGQSTLNESVASFIGETLAVRYLDEAVGPTTKEKLGFERAREQGKARARTMKVAYESLARLYDSSGSREEKLTAKQRILDALRAELNAKRPINNATLIQYKTYGSGRPELEALLRACDGSYPRMLRALERLRPLARGAKEHADPGELLEPVLAGGC